MLGLKDFKLNSAQLRAVLLYMYTNAIKIPRTDTCDVFAQKLPFVFCVFKVVIVALFSFFCLLELCWSIGHFCNLCFKYYNVKRFPEINLIHDALDCRVTSLWMDLFKWVVNRYFITSAHSVGLESCFFGFTLQSVWSLWCINVFPNSSPRQITTKWMMFGLYIIHL